MNPETDHDRVALYDALMAERYPGVWRGLPMRPAGTQAPPLGTQQAPNPDNGWTRHLRVA